MDSHNIEKPNGDLGKYKALFAAHPEFPSCTLLGAGTRHATKNVRVWQEPNDPIAWFMEPMHEGVEELAWTQRDFPDVGEPCVVHYRGALNFTIVNGVHRVERQPQTAGCME